MLACDVLLRAAALRVPEPSLSRWGVGLFLALLTASAAAVAVAMHHAERFFELAGHAFRTGQR